MRRQLGVPEGDDRHQCGERRARREAPEVERLSFEGCPGINTLRAPVPVETELKLTRPAAEKAA